MSAEFAEDAAEAQYERIRTAYFTARDTGRQLDVMPEFVSREERDTAFQAMVDVAEWNTRHPERKIP